MSQSLSPQPINVNAGRPPLRHRGEVRQTYVVIGSIAFALGIAVGIAIATAMKSKPTAAIHKDQGETISFDGREWTLVFPDTAWMPYTKRFEGKEYRAVDDHFCRVLDCTAKDGERYLVAQTYLPSGKWVNHGREERHFPDGDFHRMFVGHYRLGVESGLFQAFYRSGKLHIEREKEFGKDNGIEKGWNEDGTLQYHVRNKDGKEVEVFFPTSKKK